MTDYNDGKWHGWNGGECPVDPASVIDVHYVNALGGYGRDEGRQAGQHIWALGCLFRVTKPAPPKPPVEVIKPSDADVKAVAERCGRSSDTYRTRIIMSTFLAMKAEGLL